MVFRKLRNLVARQAQAAASKETANIQPSSDDEQPEPFLARSSLLSPTKATREKDRFPKVKETKFTSVLLLTKAAKGENKTPKTQDNTDPFELMMNYFDKRFEGIEKKLQKPNKKVKMEDTSKFKQKGNRIHFEFNQQILQSVQNLSSALNNDDTSKANDLCDDLAAKLKRRNKLIEMADRSVLGWDTVAEYEADPIASDSDDGKKIRQAENMSLTKRKNKKSNKLNLRVPRQKPSGQQFRIDGEHNGFTPPSQQTSTSDLTFDARNGPVVPMPDRRIRALVVAKKGTGTNTALTPDKETKVEGMKIDNEFSDLSNDYTIQEFDFEKGNNYPSVKGRLKKNVIFWQETLSANSAILEITDNGYKIPFYKKPKRASFCNNQSALKNKEFVEESISELLKCGSIIEAEKPPEIINPLSVSINSSGKKRLILDLRYANTHVYKDKIKFEDWKCFEHYLEGKEGYLFKFDLKKVYHHIDIFKPHQKFLGFSWVFKGNTKFFVFTVLPFG